MWQVGVVAEYYVVDLVSSDAGLYPTVWMGGKPRAVGRIVVVIDRPYEGEAVPTTSTEAVTRSVPCWPGVGVSGVVCRCAEDYSETLYATHIGQAVHRAWHIYSSGSCQRAFGLSSPQGYDSLARCENPRAHFLAKSGDRTVIEWEARRVGKTGAKKRDHGCFGDVVKSRSSCTYMPAASFSCRSFVWKVTIVVAVSALPLQDDPAASSKHL